MILTLLDASENEIFFIFDVWCGFLGILSKTIIQWYSFGPPEDLDVMTLAFLLDFQN